MGGWVGGLYQIHSLSTFTWLASPHAYRTIRWTIMEEMYLWSSVTCILIDGMACILLGMGTDQNLNQNSSQTLPSSGTWTGGLRTLPPEHSPELFHLVQLRGSGPVSPHHFWVVWGTTPSGLTSTRSVNPNQENPVYAHPYILLYHGGHSFSLSLLAM